MDLYVMTIKQRAIKLTFWEINSMFPIKHMWNYHLEGLFGLFAVQDAANK